MRAEESVQTAKATEIANREENVAVIAATQRAQEEAVQITVAATAEKEAAEARATALRTEAEAEADAEKARAEGRAAAFKVDAAGKTAINEATNILNDTQTALLVRRAMLEPLPGIIAAASKPMEQIDKISILDARGLHGDAGTSDGPNGAGNLADSAVAAAMRYRVGGPLIDALMAELGMNGGNLNSMLSGAAPASAPAAFYAGFRHWLALGGGPLCSPARPFMHLRGQICACGLCKAKCSSYRTEKADSAAASGGC